MPGVARCVVQPEAPEGWRAVLDAAGLALGGPLEPAPRRRCAGPRRAARRTGGRRGWRSPVATVDVWIELRVGPPVDGRVECLLLDVTERSGGRRCTRPPPAPPTSWPTRRASSSTRTSTWPTARTAPVYRSRDFSHLLGGLEEGQDTEAAWEAAVHPDDRAGLLAFRERLFNGASARVEFRLRQRDRSWRWVEARVTARTDEAGRRLGDGVLLDITARKASEQALEDALRRGRPPLAHRRADRPLQPRPRHRGRADRARAAARRRTTSASLDARHRPLQDGQRRVRPRRRRRRAARRRRRASAARCAPSTARRAGAARSSAPCCPGAGAGRPAARDRRAAARGGRRHADRDRRIGPIRVTVSVGGASTADGLDDADALVDAADQALYAAKRRGRDQVRTFGDALAARPRGGAAAHRPPRRGAGADGVRARGHAAAALPPGVGARRRGRRRARACRATSRCAARSRGWLHDVGKVGDPRRHPAQDRPAGRGRDGDDARARRHRRPARAAGAGAGRRRAGRAPPPRALGRHGLPRRARRRRRSRSRRASSPPSTRTAR